MYIYFLCILAAFISCNGGDTTTSPRRPMPTDLLAGIIAGTPLKRVEATPDRAAEDSSQSSTTPSASSRPQTPQPAARPLPFSPEALQDRAKNLQPADKRELAKDPVTPPVRPIPVKAADEQMPTTLEPKQYLELYMQLVTNPAYINTNLEQVSALMEILTQLIHSIQNILIARKEQYEQTIMLFTQQKDLLEQNLQKLKDKKTELQNQSKEEQAKLDGIKPTRERFSVKQYSTNDRKLKNSLELSIKQTTEKITALTPKITDITHRLASLAQPTMSYIITQEEFETICTPYKEKMLALAPTFQIKFDILMIYYQDILRIMLMVQELHTAKIEYATKEVLEKYSCFPFHKNISHETISTTLQQINKLLKATNPTSSPLPSPREEGDALPATEPEDVPRTTLTPEEIEENIARIKQTTDYLQLQPALSNNREISAAMIKNLLTWPNRLIIELLISKNTTHLESILEGFKDKKNIQNELLEKVRTEESLYKKIKTAFTNIEEEDSDEED